MPQRPLVATCSSAGAQDVCRGGRSPSPSADVAGTTRDAQVRSIASLVLDAHDRPRDKRGRQPGARNAGVQPWLQRLGFAVGAVWKRVGQVRVIRQPLGPLVRAQPTSTRKGRHGIRTST